TLIVRGNDPRVVRVLFLQEAEVEQLLQFILDIFLSRNNRQLQPFRLSRRRRFCPSRRLSLLVQLADPLLDRQLPLLRRRGPVLHQRPRAEAQLLRHADVFLVETTEPLRLGPIRVVARLAFLLRHRRYPSPPTGYASTPPSYNAW